MKIKHLILAFGGISLLAACNLDEYPYGFYSEDNFYKTEADAESAVNYIYDAINYIEYSRSIVFLGDMNTDDMEPKGDAAAANKELDGWKINNFSTLFAYLHDSALPVISTFCQSRNRWDIESDMPSANSTG